MLCSSDTTSSASRWQRRKDARPDEILDAALQLFTEKGFSATRMIDVAKMAGLSKGALYLYYANKEAIFKEVVQQRITPQIDQVESLVNTFDGSATDLLKQLINAWWMGVACTSISAIPKIITSESGNFPELAEYFTQNVVTRSRHLFSRVIRRGMDSGEFREYDAETVARLVIAPLIQATIWMHSLKPYDDEEGTQSYLQLHTEFVLTALIKDSHKAKMNNTNIKLELAE